VKCKTHSLDQSYYLSTKMDGFQISQLLYNRNNEFQMSSVTETVKSNYYVH